MWRAWRGKRRSSTDLGPFSTSFWIGIIILRRRSSSVGQNADTPKRGGRRPSEGETSAHAYQRRHGPACDAGRSGGCNGAVRRSRTRDLHDGHWAPARRGSHEDLREHEPAVGRRHGVGRRCGPLYEGTCLRLSAASSWPMGEGGASRVVAACSPAWFRVVYRRTTARERVQRRSRTEEGTDTAVHSVCVNDDAWRAHTAVCQACKGAVRLSA